MATRIGLHPHALLLPILLYVFCLGRAASALRIKSINVPTHEVAGKPVELECDYELENDVLYSVKWYRGIHEFYRYVPLDTPSVQVFDLPGVVVDTSLSDSRKVTLRSVTLQSSGQYRCEVSADSPTFHTVSEKSEMLVVVVPDEVPTISGGQSKYHTGDRVNVNCTSARSRPAASLKWYINGQAAESSYLVDYAPEKDTDGLETATLGLRFTVLPRHFPEGYLRLRCTATIAAVYWKSSEEAVEGQLPQSGPALESKGVYTGCSRMASPVRWLVPLSSLLAFCLLHRLH